MIIPDFQVVMSKPRIVSWLFSYPKWPKVGLFKGPTSLHGVSRESEETENKEIYLSLRTVGSAFKKMDLWERSSKKAALQESESGMTAS